MSGLEEREKPFIRPCRFCGVKVTNPYKNDLIATVYTDFRFVDGTLWTSYWKTVIVCDVCKNYYHEMYVNQYQFWSIFTECFTCAYRVTASGYIDRCGLSGESVTGPDYCLAYRSRRKRGLRL